MSRVDLAEKLGVSLASVNNWLSCSNIPDKRWQDIEELFKGTDEAINQSPVRVVGAAFSEEEMKRMEKAAKGQPLDLFFRDCIIEKTNDILSGE